MTKKQIKDALRELEQERSQIHWDNRKGRLSPNVKTYCLDSIAREEAALKVKLEVLNASA